MPGRWVVAVNVPAIASTTTSTPSGRLTSVRVSGTPVGLPSLSSGSTSAFVPAMPTARSATGSGTADVAATTLTGTTAVTSPPRPSETVISTPFCPTCPKVSTNSMVPSGRNSTCPSPVATAAEIVRSSPSGSSQSDSTKTELRWPCATVSDVLRSGSLTGTRFSAPPRMAIVASVEAVPPRPSAMS